MCYIVCMAIGLWWDGERGTTSSVARLAFGRFRDHGDHRPRRSFGYECLEDQWCRSACVRCRLGSRGGSAMTEPMSREQVLAGIRQEIAEEENAARREPDAVKRERMVRHARSREDYADE